MAPWILHDVHDPQSALPTRAKSQRARASRTWGDGAPAMPFSRLTISVTPYAPQPRGHRQHQEAGVGLAVVEDARPLAREGLKPRGERPPAIAARRWDRRRSPSPRDSCRLLSVVRWIRNVPQIGTARITTPIAWRSPGARRHGVVHRVGRLHAQHRRPLVVTEVGHARGLVAPRVPHDGGRGARLVDITRRPRMGSVTGHGSTAPGNTRSVSSRGRNGPAASVFRFKSSVLSMYAGPSSPI